MARDFTSEMIDAEDPRLAALLSSTFGLQQLILSFPDYVTCLDAELRIVFVNRLSDGLTGMKVLGQPSGAFVPPQNRTEYEQLARRVLAEGITGTFEFNSPVTGVAYQTRMAPLRDPAGDVLGVVSTTTDITVQRAALRRMDEALDLEREATRKLRALDGLKNEFVAKVAHDLRTPITAIQGFAETMTWRWADINDEDKLHFLTLITAGARQLMALAEEIHEVANIDSDKFSVHVEPFDLRRPVDMLAEHFAAFAPPGRIRWNVAADLPLVHGDEQRTAQVITNLVSNALKFSEPDTVIHVEAHAHEDRVRLSIVDRGPGIAADDVPRLFEKFIQLNPHPQRAGIEGSGLGLYISRSLVEAQGGSVWIESDVGVGTTVQVELPVEDA